MGWEKCICPICGADAHEYRHGSESLSEFKCPVCGNYLKSDVSNCEINDKLAAYMFYHNGKTSGTYGSEKPQNIIGVHELYERKVLEYPGITHVTDDVVNSWYPKNFSEKVDMILCALADRTEYLGQELSISPDEIRSLFMLKKRTGENTNGDAHILDDQLKFFYIYFGECGYNSEKYSFYKITLKPSAWKRIDELHKNSNGNSRTVFIAMSFKDDMKAAREQIKAAIIECQYEPIIMDELEHNGQIVPEMLYQIRQAKFVVADLTHKNNGAYYEAGYALGNGKPVIQLCRSDEFNGSGHFDVKQVCTILWNSESEIKDKLVDRIRATIV